MRIYKISSAKDKIARYKINDPYLIFFITTYENKIDWNTVKSAEDLSTQIKEKTTALIESSYQELMNPNFLPVYYLKPEDVDIGRQINILQERLIENPNDYASQQQLNMYINSAAEARRMITNNANNERRNIVATWIDYFKRTVGVVYSPVFSYYVLSNILAIPSKGQTDPPPNLNAEAVKNLNESIKSNPTKSINFGKTYKDTILQIVGARNTVIDDVNGKWIKIPSMLHSSNDYTNNVNDLMNLAQGTGWCVAGEGPARSYLNHSDFWIYYLGGTKAKVSIRIGRYDTIEELSGDLPDQAVDSAYMELTTNFINKMGFKGAANWLTVFKQRQEKLQKVKNLIHKLKTMDDIKEEKDEAGEWVTDERPNDLSKEEDKLVTQHLGYIVRKVGVLTDSLKGLMVNSPQKSLEYAVMVKYDASKLGPEILDAIGNSPDTSLGFIQGVKFDLSKISPKMIETVAASGSHCDNYAKLSGFDINIIPAPILKGIARSPSSSYYFADGLRFDLTKIPEDMIDAISKNPHCFNHFAYGLNFDLTKIPAKIMEGIYLSANSCYYFAQGLHNDLTKIPQRMVKKIIESNNFTSFIRSLANSSANYKDFRLDMLPPECLDKIYKNEDTAFNIAYLLKFDITRIPPEVIKTISSSDEYSRRLAAQLRYTNLPPEILAIVLESPDACYSWAAKYNYDYDKMPIEVINTIAKSSYYALNTVRAAPRDPAKIPQVILDSIANDLDQSLNFAFYFGYQLDKIPSKIIDRIATSASKSIQFIYSFYQQHHNAPNFASIIPTPMINTISKFTEWSYEFARMFGFDRARVPESIINTLSKAKNFGVIRWNPPLPETIDNIAHLNWYSMYKVSKVLKGK